MFSGSDHQRKSASPGARCYIITYGAIGIYMSREPRLFVGYYRVSTSAQWRSGLGLEAQRRAVEGYVKGVGGDLVTEFEEAESGRREDRPQLRAALAACKSKKATLVIAKLDRLARNLHFISELMRSGVEFVAADMPSANKLTIHIIGAMAEYERDAISERTRLALLEAKRRGVKLGNPNMRLLSQQGSAATRSAADAYANNLLPLFAALRSSGATTYASLAGALNAMRIPTRRGNSWTPAGARNVLLRHKASNS